MIDNVEFIYKVLFLIFSVIWVGNILLFRCERQIIINPILIIIAAVMVFISGEKTMFGYDVEEIKNTLYLTYLFIVIWGLIITRRKTDLF